MLTPLVPFGIYHQKVITPNGPLCFDSPRWMILPLTANQRVLWNGLFPCSSKLWLGIQQIFLLFLIILQSQGKMGKIKEIIEWATAFKTHSVLLIFAKPVIIHPHPAGVSALFPCHHGPLTTRYPFPFQSKWTITFSHKTLKCPLPA